jgi:hypothetical protein
MSSVKATPSVPVSYSVATDASLRIEPDKTDWSRAQQQSDAYRNGQGTVSFTPLPGSGQSWGGAVPVFSSSATSGGGNPASAAGFTGASLTFSTTGASTLSSLFASGSSSLPQTRPFAAAGVRGDAAGQATSTGSGTSALNYLLNHGGSGLQASAQPYLAASMYGPQPGVLVADRLTDGAKWLYEKTGGDKGPLGWAKPYAKPVIQNLDRHVVTPAAQQVRKLLPRGPTPAKPMSASPYGNATNNPNFGYGSWRGDSVPRGNPANSAPRAGSGGTPYGPQAAPPQPVQAKLNGQRVYVDPISKKVIGDANGRPVTPQSPEQYVKQQQAQRYQPVGTKTVNGGGATVQVSKDSKTGDYLVKTSGGTRKLRDLTGSNDVRSLDKVHVEGAVAKANQKPITARVLYNPGIDPSTGYPKQTQLRAAPRTLGQATGLPVVDEVMQFGQGLIMGRRPHETSTAAQLGAKVREPAEFFTGGLVPGAARFEAVRNSPMLAVNYGTSAKQEARHLATSVAVTTGGHGAGRVLGKLVGPLAASQALPVAPRLDPSGASGHGQGILKRTERFRAEVVQQYGKQVLSSPTWPQGAPFGSSVQDFVYGRYGSGESRASRLRVVTFDDENRVHVAAVNTFLDGVIANPRTPHARTAAMDLGHAVEFTPGRINLAVKGSRVTAMSMSELVQRPGVPPQRRVHVLLGDGQGGGTALMQHLFVHSPDRLTLASTEEAMSFYAGLSPDASSRAPHEFVWTQLPMRSRTDLRH